jgi:hypothetical protein
MKGLGHRVGWIRSKNGPRHKERWVTRKKREKEKGWGTLEWNWPDKMF